LISISAYFMSFIVLLGPSSYSIEGFHQYRKIWTVFSVCRLTSL